VSDERLNKSRGETRADRAETDRPVSENRELTDDERFEAFRATFYQSQLSDIPPIPGYHTCWLTTTNPRDSIQSRIRLGYELIRPEEIPGFQFSTIASGDYAGVIGVNEMVAAKIPERLYRMYMKHAHSERPNQQVEAMNAVRDAIREEAERRSLKVQEDDEVNDNW